MIEKDAIARIHAVRFAVVDGDPVRIQLGNAVGAAWVERGRLALWGLDHLSVQLRGRCLIKADVFLESDCADGV